MEAVFKESAQRTVSLAQSQVPVDTGFLRASVRASITSMPAINSAARPADGQSYQPGGEVVLAIVGAGLGDTIFVGYTAAYAGFVEYGTSRMAPRRFVGYAASQWQATVRQVSQELQARAGRARRP